MSENNLTQLQQEMDDDPALVNLVYLDTISRRLKSQEAMQKSIDEKLSKLIDLNISLININLENQKVLFPKEKISKISKDDQFKLSKIESKITSSKIESLQCIQPECSFSVTGPTLETISGQLSDLINVTKQEQTTLNLISDQTKIASDGINKSVNLIEKNQISLDNILEVNNNMTNQIGKLLDEGGNITIQGEVLSTEFTVINTIESPGHPVKAIDFTNSCDETIFLGINVMESSILPDIIDTISDDSRFRQITKNKGFKMGYNTPSIKNICLLAKQNTARFQCELTW